MSIGDYEYLYMIRQNDELAMDAVYAKFKGLLWKRAHEYVNQQQPKGVSVEDMFQEGSLGLLEAIHSYREHLNVGFAHYVTICVESSIKTALRKCRGKSYNLLDNRISLDMAISEDCSLYLSDVIETKDLRHNPEFMSHYYEAERARDLVLLDLPETDREVYLLREIGYSYAEIAEIMDTTSKNVDNIIQKVRRKLTGILVE